MKPVLLPAAIFLNVSRMMVHYIQALLTSHYLTDLYHFFACIIIRPNIRVNPIPHIYFIPNISNSMRLNYLFLLIALNTFSINAEKISYSYDSSGNRIKREIVLATKSMNQRSENTRYSEMLSERHVNIYPNPTRGVLKLDITGKDNMDEAIIQIFSVSGQQILSVIASDFPMELDISSQPDGIYILHIRIGSDESSWKIIKNN